MTAWGWAILAIVLAIALLVTLVVVRVRRRRGGIIATRGGGDTADGRKKT